MVDWSLVGMWKGSLLSLGPVEHSVPLTWYCLLMLPSTISMTTMEGLPPTWYVHIRVCTYIHIICVHTRPGTSGAVWRGEERLSGPT